MGLARDPQLAAALAVISVERIRADDSTLAAFGTRHAMGDTLSDTRGVGAARRWIYRTLSGYARDCGGCLRVEYDTAQMVIDRDPHKPLVNIVNVLAWLPGRDTTRVVVMGGHYDSCRCSLDPFDAVGDAPGADDNGSGSSAVLELTRVLTQAYPKGFASTVVFALYSGEEEGLYGSTHLAERLHRQGYHVVAGLADDMVGNVTAEDGRVDSTTVRLYGADPDNGASRELERYAWALGLVYEPDFHVLPVFRMDRIHRGSDHIPFVLAGDPGLRFTERLENYTRQHRPEDNFAHVDFGYIARIARLNAATVGSLALAPAAPDHVRATRDVPSGGQYWALAWHVVPEAVRYEILVRRTTSPTYERIFDVGADTTYLLHEQLDDEWAAVRSVGAGGARSLAVDLPQPVAVTH
jgi:hypothetical protein